jgi:exopolysaccharide production protein ExoY
MLAALAPVVAGCASVMALVSRRTPLIAHRRVGWRGQALWMLKLRTMWNHDTGDARCGWGWIEYIEDEAGPEDKRADDPRVTNRFARFCRRHSIDEIPQLWHVLRGDMSLVGPRPMTAGEIRRYYERDAEEILQVRPGIAGLWQVSGRNLLTYSERRELDLRFVRHRTLGMYFRILTRTIPEVWRGAGSW